MIPSTTKKIASLERQTTSLAYIILMVTAGHDQVQEYWPLLLALYYTLSQDAIDYQLDTAVRRIVCTVGLCYSLFLWVWQTALSKPCYSVGRLGCVTSATYT